MMHPSSIQVCIPGFCMSEIAMSLNGHVFEQRQAEKLAIIEIAMSVHKRSRVDIASPKNKSVPKLQAGCNKKRRHAEEKASTLRQQVARGPVSMESLRQIQDALYRQSR